MPVKKKRKTLTKYQRLVKAKKSYCAGRITKASLNKIATAYKTDAVKKGKSKTEATKIANKVVNGKCTLKKKTTTKKKSTTRRRRA